MTAYDVDGTDSQRYLTGEGDSNQLPREDTLLERGVEDLLDEGYSPPDYPRANHYGETALEEVTGETLDQRLAEEEPEIWDVDRPPVGREPDRAGRIVEADGARGQDVYAWDAGVAGGAASAEEAAMHIVDLESLEREAEDAFDEDEFPAPDEDELR